MRRSYPFYFTLRDLVNTAERLHKQKLAVEAEAAAADALAPGLVFGVGEGVESSQELTTGIALVAPSQRWSDGVIIRRPSVELDDLYQPELLEPTVEGDRAFFASFNRT